MASTFTNTDQSYLQGAEARYAEAQERGRRLAEQARDERQEALRGWYSVRREGAALVFRHREASSTDFVEVLGGVCGGLVCIEAVRLSAGKTTSFTEAEFAEAARRRVEKNAEGRATAEGRGN